MELFSIRIQRTFQLVSTTTGHRKNRKTCNGNIPDYGNMSADKQRDCPHRDDYAAVARRRIHRFHVQDTGHDYQGFHSSVHCGITCRITIKTLNIWKQLLSHHRLRSCLLHGHRANISDRSEDACPIRSTNQKTSATIWNHYVIFPAIRTGRIY